MKKAPTGKKAGESQSLRSELTQAEKRLRGVEQVVKERKTELKALRKAHKQVKREAKAARKEVQALKRAVKAKQVGKPTAKPRKRKSTSGGRTKKNLPDRPATSAVPSAISATGAS